MFAQLSYVEWRMTIGERTSWFDKKKNISAKQEVFVEKVPCYIAIFVSSFVIVHNTLGITHQKYAITHKKHNRYYLYE